MSCDSTTGSIGTSSAAFVPSPSPAWFWKLTLALLDGITHGAANTTSFSNWMTGFSRTSACREQSLGKLDGVTSQVGATNRILSIPVGERPTPARAKAARLLVPVDQTAARLVKGRRTF
ncbi:hypothetical protein ACVWZV_007594 [Bradyrhizobium sp. GM5.1]